VLQRYKSHKLVDAGKIQAIHYRGVGDDSVIEWVQAGGRQYPVPENFGARGKPVLNDYLVRYEDGYVSWSPAAAFESGYTLVEELGDPYAGQIARLHRVVADGPDDIQTDGSADADGNQA
jgi:hypothetical protein